MFEILFMTTTSIKVKTLLSLLFPDGTDCKDSYATVPEWPPDLFAFCAKYIDMVESYTGIITKDSDLYAAFSPAYIDELATISSNWANHSSQNHEIQRMWDVVISNLEEDMPANNSALLIAIHSLLIVSDEACMGLGFSTTEKNWIQDTYNRRNLEQLNNDLESQQHPTCCFLVPSHILCVQPKARTPQVGCNVRSLSHHLALLPPSSSVHVSWYPAESLRETGSIYSEDNFNIVIVPFPYSINARSVSGHRDTRGVGFFSLDMAWINGQEEAVVDHICRLVGEAQKDAGEVNGVVLPELALNSCAYELLVKKMKSTEYKGLQFLISGVERFDGKRNSARKLFLQTEVTESVLIGMGCSINTTGGG